MDGLRDLLALSGLSGNLRTSSASQSHAPFNPGNHLRIKCDFDVTLADYGIDRAGPILKMQVGETAHVSLSILATDATDEELAGYREGAKKYLGNDARTN